MLNRIRKSFRKTFRRRRPINEVDSRPLKKHHIRYKVALLDGTDLTFDLEKSCYGEDLVKKVLLNLDLVEKDYFGLQFMDTNQVPHWLDPSKKLRKQVKIGPPYTLHFRVKFYSGTPQDLHEELTRYHFFMQIKQDVFKGKLAPTERQLTDLCAYAVQSELGDYDPQLHQGNYVSEFRFVQDQTEQIERTIARRHKSLLGMNPADCEINYLNIGRRLENYGIDYHIVKDDDGKEVQLGLCARGIQVKEGGKKIGILQWPHIVNISFKKQHFTLTVEGKERKEMGDDIYRYQLQTARACKHLWKCAVEYHAFFRLVKTEAPVRRRTSFLKLGSRFRYSGRTLHQAAADDSVNARKSLRVKRARSERFAQRSTIGYIRVGSRVWAKAFNGDYYRGQVTDMKDKVYIKFEDGDTIAHERGQEDALVYDMDPNPTEIKIGTRVIAHWSGLAAYLSGAVSKIEGNKYYVLYDDGDTGGNSLQQMRILKPPLFFGPGSGSSKVQKSLSMKATSLIGPGHSFNEKSSSTKKPVVIKGTNGASEVLRKQNGTRTVSNSDDAFFSELDNMNEGAAVQRPLASRQPGLFGSQTSSGGKRTSSGPSRSTSSAARMQRVVKGDQTWKATVTKAPHTSDDLLCNRQNIHPVTYYPRVIENDYSKKIHARVQRDKTLKPKERRRASIEVDIIHADAYLSDEDVTNRKRRGSLPRNWKLPVKEPVNNKRFQKQRLPMNPVNSQPKATQSRMKQSTLNNHAGPKTSNRNNMGQDAVDSRARYPPTVTRVVYKGKPPVNPAVMTRQQLEAEKYIITEL